MSLMPPIRHSITLPRGILRARRGAFPRPEVRSFFDEATYTASHVVHDPATSAAAIVD